VHADGGREGKVGKWGGTGRPQKAERGRGGMERKGRG